jgi:glycosyltransferase involved in cell wall biosynthesis
MPPKVSVIIPAYNEEPTIGMIVAEIRRLGPDYEIVVVDDGSTDATALVSADSGARVVAHPYNMGNGAAVKTGVKNAAGDYLVFIDGDGQHAPADIARLLAGLDRYDMVVGARTARSPVSVFRTLGNKVFIWFASYIAGRKIPDLTSGFRAIKRERMLEFLHLLPNTFSYPSTITMALLKSGYPVQFVPLDTVRSREKGRSKVKPFADGLLFLLIIMRMAMLFDPLRLFLPASMALFVGGFAIMAYQLLRAAKISNSSVIMLVTAVFIFFFGLLADQIAHLRREIKSGG